MPEVDRRASSFTQFGERVRSKVNHFIHQTGASLLLDPDSDIFQQSIPFIDTPIPISEDASLHAYGDSIYCSEGKKYKGSFMESLLAANAAIRNGFNNCIPGADSRKMLRYFNVPFVQEQLASTKNTLLLMYGPHGNDLRRMIKRDRDFETFKLVAAKKFPPETLDIVRRAAHVASWPYHNTIRFFKEGEKIQQEREKRWRPGEEVPTTVFIITTCFPYHKIPNITFEAADRDTIAPSEQNTEIPTTQILTIKDDPVNESIARRVTTAFTRSVSMAIHDYYKRHPNTNIATISLNDVTQFNDEGHYATEGQATIARLINKRVVYRKQPRGQIIYKTG